MNDLQKDYKTLMWFTKQNKGVQSDLSESKHMTYNTIFCNTKDIFKQLYFFLFTMLLLIQFIPSWEKAEVKEHKKVIVFYN